MLSHGKSSRAAFQSAFNKAHIFTVVLAIALTACGGGGGGGSANSTSSTNTVVVSTYAFPLQQAMRSLNASGLYEYSHADGTVATEATNGLCSGTRTYSQTAAKTPTTFEGRAALSATDSTTYAYSNCTPSSGGGTGIDYFDQNYDQIGYVDESTYGVYGPWTIPTSVHVGDTGNLTSEIYYTDSTKSTVQVRRELSFVIEPDTANTAIVNVVSKSYFPDYIDTVGIVHNTDTLYSTTQIRYRISQSGQLSSVSTDSQRVRVSSTMGSSSGHHYVWRTDVFGTPPPENSSSGTSTVLLYTGAVQSVAVPQGASFVTIAGTGGGGAGATYVAGGAGGTVKGTWSLSALGSPTSLAVHVGAGGSNPYVVNTGEGNSGAGGGGGATVVSYSGNVSLLIAGGGGGGGAGTDLSAAGGHGCGGDGGSSHGNASLYGSGGGAGGTGGRGGSGGGGGGSSNGISGATGIGGGGGGGGGSATFAGGSGGTNNSIPGSGGAGGFGGAGGTSNFTTSGGYGGGGSANYGGGGGGGFAGGGAGGGAGLPAFGGGGGGGSSYIAAGAVTSTACQPSTVGAGQGGSPNRFGVNGSVTVTFN